MRKIKKGKLHCENGPAIIFENNSGEEWWFNGERHRIDGPAIIIYDKERYNGKLNGEKEWWVNGKRHRENGPAVVYGNNYQAWYVNGKRHRENGPARLWKNGRKEWYLNGKLVTKEKINPIENRVNAFLKRSI